MSRTPPCSYSMRVTAAVEWATKTFTMPSRMPAVSTTSCTPLVISMMSPLPSVDTRICALWTAIEAASLANEIRCVPRFARRHDFLEALELARIDAVDVLRSGEAARAHLVRVRLQAFDHRVAHLGETLREPRRVALVHAQQIVEHEHLAVGRPARSDADHRHAHALHHGL